MQSLLDDPNSGWSVRNKIVTHLDSRLYVPNDPSTQRGLIRAAHDPPHAGHPGIQKTLELLSHDFY
jgi:hypothetical protein